MHSFFKPWTKKRHLFCDVVDDNEAELGNHMAQNNPEGEEEDDDVDELASSNNYIK